MTKEETLNDAFVYFNGLVNELEELYQVGGESNE